LIWSKPPPGFRVQLVARNFWGAAAGFDMTKQTVKILLDRAMAWLGSMITPGLRPAVVKIKSRPGQIRR
jgi:hypothetical protein